MYKGVYDNRGVHKNKIVYKNVGSVRIEKLYKKLLGVFP